jgi:sugar phosphate isomerase/epimerase
VREFKGQRGGGPGDWAPIGEGTVDWKNVRKVLEEIRYSGWVSVEPTAGNQTLEEYSKFLDEHFGI